MGNPMGHFVNMTHGLEDAWVSENEINNLRREIELHYPGEQPEQTAIRKLREAAPIAAVRIAHMAMHAEEAVAYKASVYLLDTVLGKAGANGVASKGNTQIKSLAEMMLAEAEVIANANKKPWQ